MSRFRVTWKRSVSLLNSWEVEARDEEDAEQKVDKMLSDGYDMDLCNGIFLITKDRETKLDPTIDVMGLITEVKKLV